MFAILWFELVDLSKELDRIKLKYSSQSCSESNLNEKVKDHQLQQEKNSESQGKSKTKSKEYDNHNEEDQDQDTPNNEEPQLMTWSEIFHPDILSLCVTYGIVRHSVNTVAYLISMFAVSMFKWPSDLTSWVSIATCGASFIMISLMIKYGVFQGVRRNYFFYLSSLNLTILVFATLPLPKITEIPTFQLQVVFFVLQMFAKSWMYFVAQSSGKVLLFNTVTLENSCFIDSIRSTMGSMMRLLALSTSFIMFNYPTYFFLPLGSIQFIGTCVLLMRHKSHIGKRNKID